MAGRVFRWDRAFGTTTVPATDLLLPITILAPDETLTRVNFTYQLQGELDASGDPAPYIGQQTLVGVILTIGSTPPSPPDMADAPNADWLWYQSCQFKADQFLQEVSTSITVYQACSRPDGNNIEAQRRVPDGNNGELWLKFQSTTASDTNFAWLAVWSMSALILGAP